MKPFLATAALFAVVVGLAWAAPQVTDHVFVCDGVAYPDGERGSAIVTVMEGELPMVVAEYYGPDRVEFLGVFEDHSGGAFPDDEAAARAFAIRHYYERIR